MEFLKSKAQLLESTLKTPGLWLGVFALGFWLFSNLLPVSSGVSFERPPLAPPQQIEHFSFGFQEVMADSLWIRTLQDFDYCDSPIAENVCQNKSWLFQMLDAVTNLSPHFRLPYAAGALALTVIITDVEGATQIFEKGIKVFPHDWPLLYRAAYHYLYEVGNKERAAQLLIAAADNGAPSWLYSLAGRLYSDSGKIEMAEALLQEMIASKQDAAVIQRLREKIASVKKGDSHRQKPTSVKKERQ